MHTHDSHDREWPLAQPDTETALSQLRDNYARADKRTVPCPLCGQPEHLPLVQGDRHELGLTTVICRGCGLGYLSPRPSAEWFSSFYEHGYWPVYVGLRFRDADHMYDGDFSDARASQILDRVLPILPGSPRVCLDIGCGQGAMLANLRSRFPSASLLGVEPSRLAAAYARRRHGLHVVADLDDHTVREVAPYDLVTSIHVLEHTLDPHALLKKLRALLAPGGYAYIEVPDLESDAWRRHGVGFFHIAHTLYWSEHSLVHALERHGLEAIAVIRGAAEVWPWAFGVVARAISGDRSSRGRTLRPANTGHLVAHVTRMLA